MTSADDRPPRKVRWEINRDALDRLLTALDDDRDAASREYEALRRRLMDVFAWEGSEAPAELADETLDRLAKRLSEGVVVERTDIARYAFGIARLLLLETARARRTRDAAMREMAQTTGRTDESEALWEALGRCLEQLPPESRRLIEAYYAGDREALARSLGISINALRNRALRIRQLLHDCVSRQHDV